MIYVLEIGTECYKIRQKIEVIKKLLQIEEAQFWGKKEIKRSNRKHVIWYLWDTKSSRLN